MTDTQVDPLLPADPVDFDQSTAFGPAAKIPIFEDETPEPPSEEDQAANDLDDKAKADFEGLLHLGYLEDECKVAGHRFLLRTPSQDDRLDMGQVHKPFLNTMSTEPAWQMILVASYLRRIDSVPAPDPLSAGVSGVRTRFDWVKNSIVSPVVISMLYLECMALAARERAVVEYLDRLGGA